MANTLSQLYIQLVFATQGRQSLIPKSNREFLHKFISGIISKRGQKLLSIFCMPDHIHLLVSIDPNIAISDFVREIKSGSSKFINDSHWTQQKFNWQAGYGAFSYSKSQIDQVVKYILNQEEHHQKRSFKDEYLDLLKKFEIDYDDKYLYEFLDS